MSHSNHYTWIQCSTKNPCPECGATHHCTVSTNGIMSKCMKSPGGRPIKQSDGQTAYLRRVSQCLKYEGGTKRHKPKAEVLRLTAKEIENQIKQCKSALSQRRLTITAKSLGVSEHALTLLGIGWHDGYGCAAFPMHDGHGKPVGIRLRREDGRKLCVPGSRTGLFIPTNFNPAPCAITLDPAPLVLLMPEGPTDVAAALDLGFMAIGRPNNAGGAGDLKTLLTAAPAPIDLILFSDYDGAKFLDDGTPYSPGWEGALHLARELVGHSKLSRLRVVMPPAKSKDLRQWMKDGGTAEMVATVLTNADTATARWIDHKLKALTAWKKETKRLLVTKEATDRADALRKAKARLVKAPSMA